MTRAPAGPSREQVESACGLLGVREGTSREGILAAWKAAIRGVHPDLADEADREAAEERTKMINLAKEQLLGALDSKGRLELPPRSGRQRHGTPSVRTVPVPQGRSVRATPVTHSDGSAPQRPVAPQAPAQPRVRPQHAVRRAPPGPIGPHVAAAVAGPAGSHEGDRGNHRVLLVAVGLCALVLVLMVLGAYLFSRISTEPQPDDVSPSTPVAPAGMVWVGR